MAGEVIGRFPRGKRAGWLTLNAERVKSNGLKLAWFADRAWQKGATGYRLQRNKRCKVRLGVTRNINVMGRVERGREIARRRTRRAKIKKLRARYENAKDQGERAEILAKARRMSPFIQLDDKQDDE